LPFVTVFAVAALGKNRAKPLRGAGAQVKQMLDGRRFRGAEEKNSSIKTHAAVIIKACIQHAFTKSGYTAFIMSATRDYDHCIHGACT
jgi:hypothetical protein